MTIQIELWHLITLAISVVMGFWAVAKVTGHQFQKVIDSRFQAQSSLAEANFGALNTRMENMERASRAEAKEWSRIEREMLKWQADVPSLYVRREDYIRGQSTIEAKLDSLAARLENFVLKNAAREGRPNASN